MKHKFLLKTMLLLSALIAGSGSAWADSYTITFGNNASSATGLTSSTNASTVISDGTDYVESKPFTVNSGNVYYGDTKTCIRIGKSGNDSSLTIALSASGQVSATTIVVNCNNTGGKNNSNATLSVNDSAEQTTTTTADDYTFTINSNIESITLEGSASIRIYSITVNYSTSGGGDTFTVTYDANGGAGSDFVDDNGGSGYASGATVTVLANEGNADFTKAGYTFSRWNTEADGSGDDYDEDDTFEITSNTKLYAQWNAKTITGLTYEGTPTKTTYHAGENFNPAGLTVTATFSDSSSEDVTASVSWTPAPLTEGTTSVTGTYMGQTINVTGLTVTAAPGSDAEHAYTVAQALAASPSTGVFVRGIVSTVASTSLTSNGQIRYYISDDGTTSKQMNIYNGLGINGAEFSSINDLQVGDEVVITGDISVYQNANQFNANNQLVSLKLVAPTFSKAAGDLQSGTSVEIADLHTDATIYYTTNGDNPTTSSNVYSAAIVVSEDMTIKAIAVKDGYTTSNVASVSYTVVAPIPGITITAATPVNVIADGAYGELELSYENFVVSNANDFAVQFYDENDYEVSKPDWIAVDVEAADPSGYEVVYVVEDNSGAARTTYFKVFADAGADFVYSNKVTITQAAYVAPPTIGSWVLATAGLADINANDVFVIVGDNGDTYAMTNDNGTSAPAVAEVTVVSNTLSGTIDSNLQWNLGTDDDGYIFYPNGTTESWLYCTNTNNGVKVGTGNAKHFTIDGGYLTTTETNDQRYIGIYNSQDWRCYTNTTGNIADQTFAFYKKLAAKLNGNGYATFSATVPVDFSDASEFSAWVITGISGTTISFAQVTGAVPANTGVLLKGTAGETVYPVAADSGTAPETNLLTAVATSTAVANDGDYYGLSGNTFVKVKAGTVPAGKALLPKSVVEGAGVKAFTFVFEDDDATGVETIDNGQLTIDNEIYNLAGQRLQKMQKGINIVNGKKVLF